jgi:hypothetical protein
LLTAATFFGLASNSMVFADDVSQVFEAFTAKDAFPKGKLQVDLVRFCQGAI